jgi:hypothetical protein
MTTTGEALHRRTVWAGEGGLEGVHGGLLRVVSVLTRLVQALVLTLVSVLLMTAIVLVVAGTYGILHNGDDFDFGGGGGGNVTGDVIRTLR